LPKQNSVCRIGVQIRHFDAAARGQLGAKKQFQVEEEMAAFAQPAREAIAAKQKVDPKVPPVTILLLVCLHPIPEDVRSALLNDFEHEPPLNAYRETWVYPQHGPAFRLQSQPPQA
jgi:hypothetical protein